MPNQLVIPLSKNSNKTRNRLLNPQGLIKIEIKHAKNLKAADFNLFGDDTSDAYCVINVSNHQFKTKVIPETCNPVWNEEFLAIIYQFQGQALQIECFDKDYNSDDKLGECFIRLEKLVNEITERYYRLEFGKIYMKTSWLTYSENLEISDDSIEQLAVYVKIHSAQDLPRTKQNMHEPSTLVITSMGQVNHETGIQKHNCFPKWNECFYFYTNNLTHEYLTFTIRTKKEILYTSREELIAFKNSNGAKKQIVLIRKDYKSTLAVTVKIMNFSSIDKVIVEEKEIKQESEENRSQIDIKPINDKLKTFDDQNLSIRLRIFYCIKKKLLICHIYHIKILPKFKNFIIIAKIIPDTITSLRILKKKIIQSDMKLQNSFKWIIPKKDLKSKILKLSLYFNKHTFPLFKRFKYGNTFIPLRNINVDESIRMTSTFVS